MYNNYYNQPSQIPPIQNNNNYNNINQNNKLTGISIAAFTLGLIGFLSSCLFFGGILCLISLIFAIIDLRNANAKHGLSIASLVLSIIGMLCSVLMLIGLICQSFLYTMIADDLSDYPNGYYNDYDDYDYFEHYDDYDMEENDAPISL